MTGQATIGPRPVVVGAGNVAMDVVRTAIRVPGVEKVTVVTLETWDEMPADDLAISPVSPGCCVWAVRFVIGAQPPV